MYHTFTHIYTARQNVVSRRVYRESSKHEENKMKKNEKNEIVELQTLKDIRAKNIYFW
jgi:hypothetical protein